jgi:hypothetical protein
MGGAARTGASVDRQLANADRRLLSALSEAEHARNQLTPATSGPATRSSQSASSPAHGAHGHLTHCIAEIEAARRALRTFARSNG